MPAQQTYLARLLTGARDAAPTLAVLLGFAVVAYWGYRNDWRLPAAASSGPEEGASNLSDPRPRVIPSGAATLNGAECPYAGSQIRFASPDALARAGIKESRLRRQSLAASITAPAEVQYDQTRLARLASPTAGRIWRVEREIGDRVKKGDVLALVDAAKVGDAKAELLQAITQASLKANILSRMRIVRDAVAGRSVQEAEANLRDARVRLFNAEQTLANLGLPVRAADMESLPEAEQAARIRFLGLPDSLVQGLPPETVTSNLLPLKSSLDGLVVERDAVIGELADPTKPLFVVADLGRVWVQASARLEDAEHLAVGQPMTFQPDGHPRELLRGQVSWKSTTTDERTRTMPVRAVVDNPSEHVAASTFGVATITVRDLPDALVAPQDAVQREGDCSFVFVKSDSRTVTVWPVRTGITSNGVIEIIEGLEPETSVITQGSFILKAELLKSQLGEAD